MPRAVRPLAIAFVTTVLVTGLSYALPDRYAATGVGLAFLAATWFGALRGDDAQVPHYGLALGGLMQSGKLSPRRILKEGSRALLWAIAFAAVIFPFFWLGYRLWWKPHHAFTWVMPSSLSDEILGQILVIALPEEAFYRGYLQTAFDDAWTKRVRIVGAQVGWGLLASCALFGVGHFLTEPRPERLAVFFPSLVFGWLRARTGGIGASVALHAMANIFASTLGRGYGLIH